MSDEARKSWVCPSCVSKKPREAKNDSTPIRRKMDSNPNITVATEPIMLENASVDSCCVHEENLRRIIKLEFAEVYDSTLKDLVVSVKKLQASNETLMQMVRDLSCTQTEKTQLHDKADVGAKLDGVTPPAQQHGKAKPGRPKKNHVPSYASTVRKFVPAPPPAEMKRAEQCAQIQEIPREESQNIQQEESAATDESEWKTVQMKRPRRSSDVIRGTAAPGSTTLRAAERKSFIHVYFLKVGTTADQVLEHLNSIRPDDTCTAESLKPRGDYASFKVGVPSKHVTEFLCEKHWDEDVHVKPWHTFRKSRGETEKTTA